MQQFGSNMGSMFSGAVSGTNEMTNSAAKMNRSIATARYNFKATYPNKKGHKEAKIKYEEALFYKDMFYLMTNIPQGNSAYVGTILRFFSQLDGGIHPEAKDEFDMWSYAIAARLEQLHKNKNFSTENYGKKLREIYNDYEDLYKEYLLVRNYYEFKKMGLPVVDYKKMQHQNKLSEDAKKEAQIHKAQVGTFNKSFGSRSVDYFNKVIVEKDGNYISVWKDIENGLSLRNIDLNGNVRLEKNFSQKQIPEQYYKSIVSNDDGYLLVTFGNDNEHIYKLDKKYNTLWKKSFKKNYSNKSQGSNEIYDIKATTDGGSIAVGTTVDNTVGKTDAWVFKLSKEGKFISIK